MTNILTNRVSPIHISFPLLARTQLTVSVWRRLPPDAEGNILHIEVTNASSTPVEVTGISVGFMHTFLPAELVLGKRSTTFPLSDIAGLSTATCIKRRLGQVDGQSGPSEGAVDTGAVEVAAPASNLRRPDDERIPSSGPLLHGPRGHRTGGARQSERSLSNQGEQRGERTDP